MAAPTQAPPSTEPKTLNGHFLTREEHKKFRAGAKLNAALDNVLPRPAGKSLFATIENAEQRGLYEYMLVHSQTLVSQHEVVAIVVCGKSVDGKKPVTQEPEVVNIKDPRILIAANPDPADYEQLSKVAKDGYEHRVTLSKFDATSTDAPPTDIIAHVVGVMRRAPGQPKPKSQPIFFDHVRTYFQFLRQVHAAESVVAHTEAVQQLRNYVFTKCHPKMLARFASGDQKLRGTDDKAVNLWDILDHDVRSFPAHAEKIPMPASLAGRIPTKRQAHLIRQAWPPIYEEAFVNVDLYTTHTDRMRFHGMLQHYLRQAKTELENLSAAFQGVIKEHQTHTQADVLVARDNARVQMILLCNFVEEFDGFLLPHFQWLAQCANVVDFRDQPTWTVPVATTPSPYMPAVPKKTHDYPDAVDNESSDDGEYLASFEKAQMSAKNRIWPEGQVTNSVYLPWALGCQKYVRIPCLHESNIRRATVGIPGRKQGAQIYESSLIKQAQVAVVNFEIKSWDRESAMIDEKFLQWLKDTYQSELRPADLLKHLKNSEKIKVGKLIQNLHPFVQGAPHCESVLISLYVIAKTPSIMEYVDDEWLSNNGVFATKEDLLDLADMIEQITVSKRNCPPCEKARALMSELAITRQDAKGKHVEFVSNGSHAQWSGVILPQIMPAKLGRPIMIYTLQEAANKLIAFQKIMDQAETTRLMHKHSPQSEEDKKEKEKKATVDSPYSASRRAVPAADASIFGFPSPSTPGGPTTTAQQFTSRSSTPDTPTEGAAAVLPHGVVRPERDFTQDSQGGYQKAKLDDGSEEGR